MRLAVARRLGTGTALLGVVVLTAIGVAQAGSVGVSSDGLGVVSVPVAITTTTLTAVADTDANQSSPGSNYGTATTLNVRSFTAANRRTFVTFNLSGIPATARIQLATLKLRMSTAPTASRTYEAGRAAAAWGETTLTWTNQPAAASATATVVSGTTSGVDLTWNVTPDVASFAGAAATATNFGWRIKDMVESSSVSRLATFRSRQYSTVSQRPQLTVVYAS